MKKSIGPKTILFPAPTLIVCTYDKDNRPNAAAVAWGGICCSSPPCVNISLRKATYTYGSIMLHKAFTVNVPSEKYIREADYFGVASGRDRNKIDDTGLTVVKSDLVHAPYIEEFPITLECRVVHTHELGRHTIFIGEILDTKADEACLNEKNTPDPEKVQPVIYAPGNNKYFGLGKFLEKSHCVKEWR
jgi:flavin reductase (DIM6/NTAB) family NADH-FMN oxidoreductase RutF